ncbi:BTB/POZ domain-containing protein [Camellia lanceoleosa]|uniref:BTB/POZ domain-containing protein n=1 Tax=Camellia lanceoleosa TaxID=1840588 RepID=A0ACC0I312_9ERIC|nr:BTB/POZ domain-containing protein [Camellia lanceoleosa]
MGIQKNTVKFNVGGKIFETTATTLANAGRNSLFGAMFDENWNLQTHNFDEYFIDRNPNCVAVLLDLLEQSSDPPTSPEKLIHEKPYFTASSTISGCEMGPIRWKQLWFSRCRMGQALAATAIRPPVAGHVARHGSMDNYYISLLDFRDKSMVWSWSDVGAPVIDERRVRDAIAMEETGSICVVNEYEDLGFMDLRSRDGSVRWCSRSQLMKRKMPKEPCYPKLALHDGQLFSSMNDSISVFCGPD